MEKYFDYAATTPCRNEVVDEMNRYWNIDFGNADSRSHEFGWIAENAIEKARKIVAYIIGALPSEIIFTSGATEANNLAIKGFVEGPSYNQKTVASLVTEHKCVIETLRYLNQSRNIPIDFIPVKTDGLINMDYLRKNIENYSLISIGYVNNETGVIQNIPEISELCRKNNVKLHTDCAQAFCKVNVNAREVDLLSISGHKIYGPKGVGVLFVSKTPRIRIKALMHGGGQEKNLRSGTMATPLCVGLGKAAELCYKEMIENTNKFLSFQEYIVANIVKQMPEVSINGCLESKVPNILNLSIPYVEGESLMMRLKDFALSSGSACTSKSLEPSYVISAMNPDAKELAHSSLRISFGRYTTMEDVITLTSELKKHIAELRELSPLWSMVQKGIDLKSISWMK